jgi:hypothetical protein
VVYTEHEYSQFRLILMGNQDQNAVLSKKATLLSVGCLSYQTFEKSRFLLLFATTGPTAAL